MFFGKLAEIRSLPWCYVKL